MNINVIMAINADGNIIRRNMFALPTKVFECEGLHKVFDHRLVMIPKTILPKMYGGMPPMQFGLFTSRVLVATSERGAARLTVGFQQKSEEIDVGDITIIGSPTVTETLESMGIDYNLTIIAPLNTPIPEEFYDGFARDGSDGDELYTVHYFKPSIAGSSDLKISSIIDGIESGTELTDEEQAIVDRFAGDFAKAYEDEMSDDESNFDRIDSYDDGNDEHTMDDEIGKEIDKLWRAVEMTACQVRTCIQNTKDVADAFNKFKYDYENAKNAEKYTTPVYKDMLPLRVTTLESEYNGVVNQFAALKTETDEQVNALETTLQKMRIKMFVFAILLLIAWTVNIILLGIR